MSRFLPSVNLVRKVSRSVNEINYERPRLERSRCKAKVARTERFPWRASWKVAVRCRLNFRIVGRVASFRMHPTARCHVRNTSADTLRRIVKHSVYVPRAGKIGWDWNMAGRAQKAAAIAIFMQWCTARIYRAASHVTRPVARDTHVQNLKRLSVGYLLYSSFFLFSLFFLSFPLLFRVKSWNIRADLRFHDSFF